MHGFTLRGTTLAIALGALGGAALVLCAAFFTTGKFILLPWAAFVIASICVIRAERVNGFAARFAIGTSSFLIASGALYVAIALSPAAAPISFAGHLWRLALLAALSVAVNLPAARLSAPPATAAPNLAAV